MNQPRYSDNGSGNSWQSSGNRRNTSHSTGRSNYGGSGGISRGKNEKKGIGKWIQNRRQRRRQRSSNSNTGPHRQAVGTEANAIQNMATNAKNFSYPSDGFITPIEHSLLYAMIEYPERYPESVVKNEIEEEEFEVYFYVNDSKKKGNSAQGGNHFGDSGNNGGDGEKEENEEGSDQATAQSDQHATGDAEEYRVSYAQLSALAALSAEKNPSMATPEQDNASTTRPSSSTNNSSSSGNPPNRSNNSNGNQNNPITTNSAAGQSTTLSIGQTLVRKLIRTITRYSDSLELDRQHEIREFLTPIEKRCQLRNERAALQQLLPAYAGYTISLMTGNPLPLLIGAAALTQKDPMLDENSNVSGFRTVGGRAADLETAGLLDECESD